MTEDEQFDGPPPVDELTGEIVIFEMDGRKFIGTVTENRGKIVLIDAGAGELEIERNKILMVVDDV